MEKEEMMDLIEKLDFENYKFYILVDFKNEIANYIKKDKIKSKIKELETEKERVKESFVCEHIIIKEIELLKELLGE